LQQLRYLMFQLDFHSIENVSLALNRNNKNRDGANRLPPSGAGAWPGNRS